MYLYYEEWLPPGLKLLAYHWLRDGMSFDDIIYKLDQCCDKPSGDCELCADEAECVALFDDMVDTAYADHETRCIG